MVRDLVLDASTFFAKNRFNFMLKLLEEEELQPDRIIIPSDLYHIFSKWIRGTSTEKGQEKLRNIVWAWEGAFVGRAMRWILSGEFQWGLRIFFEKWKPMPAGEIIGYQESNNPINLKELVEKFKDGGRAAYEELRVCERLKTCILTLSRGLSWILRRIHMHLIEVPLTKKKKFMKKHSFLGGLFFYIVLEISIKITSQQNIAELLKKYIQTGSPLLQDLLTGVNLMVIAQWLYEILVPLGVALISAIIIFDSISVPKKLIAP